MALTNADKKEIEKIAKREVASFLNSTDAHKKVIAMIKKELGNKDMDDKMVDVSVKVVSELFKTLWQRKNFWEGALKNVKP